MNVQDLIRELQSLPSDLPVCGPSPDESICVLDTLEVKTADEYHDSLDEGEVYVRLYFNTSLKEITRRDHA